MIQFDWAEKIQNQVFKSWLDTKGAGVKIAVLDTGVDLSHQALKHLNKLGHKFNAAKPGFNPAQLNPSGDDDINDLHRKKGHGTQCLSTLTAMAEDGNALLGFVPLADFYILKINTPDHKFFKVKDFLKGLEAAINLGVDLIVASVSFAKKDVELEGVMPAELDRVFGLLSNSDAVLFASLPNRDDDESWVGLPAANFPSMRPEVVNVGAITQSVLVNRRAEIDGVNGIHFLVATANAQFCKIKNEYVQEAISSSYATYLVAGVAALYIASIKKREQQDYKVRPITNFLKGLSQKFEHLLEAPDWDGTSPVFYKTSAVQTGPADETIS
ncbi:MAG: S8 family serine peptidase [Bacteroidetes bacterium]|nr:S8 family serine peptidase [Bacteroidota bacterium]